jgi:histidine triad (HIT) family protein
MSCIFCKIVDGSAASKVFYQDEEVIVFHDHSPKAPIHLLICPKNHYADFLTAPAEVRSRLAETVEKVSQMLGERGRDFRIQINNGPGSGQLVFHLHYHFLAQG